MRGYYGIGICYGKKEVNVGTLWRSAYQLGASFIFTVGQRYGHQHSDTTKAWRSIPYFEYEDFEDFQTHRPKNAPLVGVEFGGVSLSRFTHPERCIYLLGAEDSGLPKSILEECQFHVQIDSVRELSFNVAVAGSIVLYDRVSHPDRIYGNMPKFRKGVTMR